MNKSVKLASLPLALSILCVPHISAQQQLYGNMFPLDAVELNDSIFSHSRELNIATLLQYDTDRLLQPFMREAGLPTDAKVYPNWDGLSGHVGGHYLSALAIHYAATGNEECLNRLQYMIDKLAECQKAAGDGYLCGVPDGRQCFESIRDGNVGEVWNRWVPWYNIHKTYAGLRDAWLYAGIPQAKDMFLNLCDWGLTIIEPLTDAQMESMLDNEFGGMNEVYADAYDMTGDTKYLDAAIRFSHHWLLDSMAKGVDNLDNKHANTQVPKAIGYQRTAEMCRKVGRAAEADYFMKAAEFFWKTVAQDRSLAIGGNSRREHFASASDCISYVDDREGPETCNTYNMIKLSEGLLRMTGDAKYADFIERALYNHILSTQHPEHGGYVYFTSARPGHYRVYSQPNQAMWCCVGTGMENHGKYNQNIFSHKNDSLWVNLFMPASVEWKDKKLTLTQTSDFPQTGNVSLGITCSKPVKATILVRHPSWCADNDMTILINGKKYDHASTSSSYVPINRKWKNGDKIEIEMPMKVTVEHIPHLDNYIAIVRGPIVLGSLLNTDDLYGLIADDSRWGHIAHGSLVSVFDTPILIGDRDDLVARLNELVPVSGKPMHFTAPKVFSGKWANIELQPFATLHDCRYMMYWLSMGEDEYADYKQRKQQEEALQLAIDRRTVDAVSTGEQQPEVDHLMKNVNSQSGVNESVAYRMADRNGFFEYTMKTDSKDNLVLMVKYWGNDSGNRKFDIHIDDTLLVSENNTGRWNEREFKLVEYEIPAQLLADKSEIKVRFSGTAESQSPGIYHVRLCTK